MITKIFIILLLCTAFSGCGKVVGQDERDVIASIGKRKITMADFNERIANLPSQYKEIVRNQKEEYLQELINDTLLYEEAVRKNIHKNKDVQKVIAEAKKKILIARLLKDGIDDKLSISEDEVIEYYNANKDKYKTPETMRVSHILTASRSEAEAICEEIAKGTRFEDLAKARSIDPTAQRGGDIGYFPKGQLMSEFEDVCSELSIGEVSGVVKTQLGYHIIKLTDRRSSKLRLVEEVEDNIKTVLRTLKRQTAFNKLLKDLRQKADIKINIAL